jgi:hypothetical protein
MELAKLPELIEKINFDIPKFNERVKNLISDLNNRGQTSDDLTFNIFQAYKQVSVKAFTIFINRTKDQEDDTDAISTSFIMDKAENKFKTLQKEGNWTVKEKDEDKIMVLQAKIKHLEKANCARSNRKDQNLTKKKGHKKGTCNPKHKIDILADKTLIDQSHILCHYAVYDQITIGPSKVGGIIYPGVFVANALIISEESGPLCSFVGTYEDMSKTLDLVSGIDDGSSDEIVDNPLIEQLGVIDAGTEKVDDVHISSSEYADRSNWV